MTNANVVLTYDANRERAAGNRIGLQWIDCLYKLLEDNSGLGGTADNPILYTQLPWGVSLPAFSDLVYNGTGRMLCVIQDTNYGSGSDTDSDGYYCVGAG